MPIRPYSFRYPYNIETTLDRWRQKLSSLLTSDDTVTRLSDRDRALEDYLSLGIGQGILAPTPVFDTNTALAYGVAETDIPGMTATFSVPPGRLLRMTCRIVAINTAPGVGIVTLRVRDQNNVILATEAYILDASGGQHAATSFTLVAFIEPTAGEHTWRATVDFNTSGVITSSTNNDLFLTIEDVGPAN